MNVYTLNRVLPSRRGLIELQMSSGESIPFVYSDTNPPKELMDNYENLVGNGLARVSVSADFGTKNYGNGVSSLVTISLTCNQDAQSIANAYALASNLARFYVIEQHKMGEQEYQKLSGAPVPTFG